MDAVAFITVNGAKTAWKQLENTVELPVVEIYCPEGSKYKIEIKWKGKLFTQMRDTFSVAQRETIELRYSNAKVTSVFDPQKIRIELN